MAGVEQRPYLGIERKQRVLPLIGFENRWVSVTGPELDVKLPSAGPVAFRLRVRYALDGYEADDAPALDGMAERKGSVWVGGGVSWRNPLAQLSAEVVADASRHSKGRQVRLQVERGFQLGRFEFTPRAAAIGVDGRYVDYYYGVRAQEQRAGRAAYVGVASVNAELGLRIGYGLAPGQLVFADAGTTWFGRGIRNSPLLERTYQPAARLAYVYQF